MSNLKLFALFICSVMLLSCHSGSITSPPSAEQQPMITTLSDGTTVMLPSDNFAIAINQSLQIPITVVGGNSLNGESLSISADLIQNLSSTQIESAQTTLNSNLPIVSVAPNVISLHPQATSITYLTFDASNAAIGTYLVQISGKYGAGTNGLGFAIGAVLKFKAHKDNPNAAINAKTSMGK